MTNDLFQGAGTGRTKKLEWFAQRVGGYASDCVGSTCMGHTYLGTKRNSHAHVKQLSYYNTSTTSVVHHNVRASLCWTTGKSLTQHLYDS